MNKTRDKKIRIRIQIDLSNEDHDSLKQLAGLAGTTESDAIRRIIRLGVSILRHKGKDGEIVIKQPDGTEKYLIWT